jgi:hypothetical protein
MKVEDLGCSAGSSASSSDSSGMMSPLNRKVEGKKRVRGEKNLLVGELKSCAGGRVS